MLYLAQCKANSAKLPNCEHDTAEAKIWGKLMAISATVLWRALITATQKNIKVFGLVGKSEQRHRERACRDYRDCAIASRQNQLHPGLAASNAKTCEFIADSSPPCGVPGIFWAGMDASDRWPGYFDGAIRAGKMASLAALEKMLLEQEEVCAA